MPSFKFASATGSGSSLIVTCSDQFAGKTITCTNGTKTYTRTCPSTSPYEVVFKGVAPGTWTVSGVVEGTTYSQQVVITDFDVTLTAGFDYKQWVTLGGLDPTDYTDLEDVFADEVAVRRLMTIHASADYLIEKVTDDVDAIDDFTANDTAMKWIGLRDYVCDGLTAITGVEAKFMASQYWERYLKDHVPIMTSNSSPYGTASAYQVFDGSSSTSSSATSFSYKFTNPICVKRFECSASGGTLSGSNNGSTYTTISNPSENTDYYLYYKVTFSASTSVHTLQFYGRSLDVSVPAMTSNTAPYGEVSASGNTATATDTYSPYRAFSGSGDQYGWLDSAHNETWLQYDFGRPIELRMVYMNPNGSSGFNPISIQGSNDGSEFNTLGTIADNAITYKNIETNDSYRYIRVSGSKHSSAKGYKFQFYGLDYSEREFAEGSTMKYLYDHGVELENIEINDDTTKEDDYISIKGTTTTYYGMIVSTNSIDLTDYSIVRVKIGDAMSGNVQIQASTQKTSYNSGRIGYKTFNVAASDLPNNLYYDVSAVNQNAYPNIVTAQVNSTIDISEWWLE